MITPTIRLIGVMLALCSGLVGLVCALAQTQDPPPYVAAFLPDSDPGCPAPCWQGLRPGYIDQDTLDTWIANPPDDWRVALVASGTAPSKVITTWDIELPDGTAFAAKIYRIHEPSVEYIELSSPGIVLGDVIAALGEPDSVSFVLQLDGLGLQISLYYPAAQLVIYTYEWTYQNPILRPDLPVYVMNYVAQPFDRPATGFAWRGFGPITRYYPRFYEEYEP